MRRVSAVLLCFAALVAPASGATSHQSWAKPQIALLTSRGILTGAPSAFHPSDPLTAGTLAALVSGLAGKPAQLPSTAGHLVSIAGLDSTLVDALGLRTAARDFAAVTRSAGLDPPARFGTEVAARLLGLRTDLPPAEDSLELQPLQTATRADAAFSAARVVQLSREAGSPVPGATDPLAAAEAGGGVRYVQRAASTFALPALDPWQQRILQTAVSLIGYPYVWGGEDEKTERGFDCSGLIWRVYKLASYRGAPGLPGTLQGRTAAAMAGEVPKRMRIAIDDLQPGDVLFFGHGRKSKPAQIDHAALYLGNGWLIQSSGQGVSLGQLDWTRKAFAWARRPLAEAGLEGPAAISASRSSSAASAPAA